jgi:hypothetical protein
MAQFVSGVEAAATVSTGDLFIGFNKVNEPFVPTITRR